MDESKSSWAVPIIVIIAVVAIAAGFFYYGPKAKSTPEGATTTPTALTEYLPAASGANIKALRAVDTSDKVRGSLLAPIKLIVYSDLECPACKYFHEQLLILDDTYVKTGKVAIIFRNFPLDSLHSKARSEAVAAECVNEIGGNDKYWQFIDKIFEITPSNNGLDPALLGSTAKNLGIATKDFDACVKSKKFDSAIQKGVDEATALGAQGTPFFVVTGPDNVAIPIFGGIAADTMTKAFDLMLGETTTASTTATN